MASGMTSFSEVLKHIYSADKVQNIVYRESAFLASKQREIDGMYEQVAAAAAQTMWGRAPPKPAVGQLSAAGLVAVTTFCAMEWLRHRKAEVAAAEQSGDYTTLIEEFAEWLRALFASWRKALGMEEA